MHHTLDNPHKNDAERGQVDFFNTLGDCLHMEVGHEVREVIFTPNGGWQFDYFRVIFDDATYSTCDGIGQHSIGDTIVLNCNYCAYCT